MSNLRIGVVGVGALGKHHARILAGMDGVELVAVADVNRAAADTIADQFGCEAFGDYLQLLDRVEAAVVAVPTFAHLAVAHDFLQRGIPVLIEKPLALNVAESRQLVELADIIGTPLQVGHIERFNPAVRTAWPLFRGRRAEGGGQIGDTTTHHSPLTAHHSPLTTPKYIRAERFSPFAFRSMDIGVVLDVMIHDIDLVLSLVDSPVRNVEAFGLSILGKQEDSVQARLTFENGCIADLSANRVHPSTHRMMQVISLDGSVSIDMQAREVTCYGKSDRLRFGPSPLELASRPGADVAELKQQMFGEFITVERQPVPVTDALTDELHSFISCIRNGEPPLVGGGEALAAMTIAEEILQCVAAHEWDGSAHGPIGPFATPSNAHRRAA